MVLCLSSSRRCCSLILVLLLLGFAGTAPGVAGFQPASSQWSLLVRRTTTHHPKWSREHANSNNALQKRTRSWSSRGSTSTQLHQAAALAALDGFFQSFPYAAAALTCGFKASTADLVAQNRSYRKRNEKEALKAQAKAKAAATLQQQPAAAAAVAVALEPPAPQTTDVKRNVAFLLYGALYQGVSQGE